MCKNPGTRRLHEQKKPDNGLPWELSFLVQEQRGMNEVGIGAL